MQFNVDQKLARNHRVIKFLKRIAESEGGERISKFRTLAKAFVEAGAYDEAVEYWKSMAANAKDSKTMELYVMFLADTLDAKKDPICAFNAWKSLLEAVSKRINTDVILKRLVDASKKLGNQLELVSVCEARVKSSPSDFDAVNTLAAESREVWDNDTQLRFWKGVARNGGDDSIWVMEQLEAAFGRKGDEKRELKFWKHLVRRHPSSYQSARLLQRAFDYHGDDESALAFWRVMADTNPENNNVTRFFAKACEQCDDIDTAISLYKNCLVRFHRDQNSSWHDPSDYDENTFDVTVESLQEALTWKGDFEYAITVWENLMKYIWLGTEIVDPRPRALATALLARSRQLDGRKKLAMLQKGASLCPDHNLLANTLYTHMCEDSKDDANFCAFWSEIAINPEHSVAAFLRLAQYYSMKRRYEDMLRYLVNIPRDAVAATEWSSDIDSTLNSLDDAMEDARQSWYEVVRSCPENLWMDHLVEICSSKDISGNLEVWKRLVAQHPTNPLIEAKIPRVCKWNVETEVEFWKALVRSTSSDGGGLTKALTRQANSCKTAAARSAHWLKAVEFWELELVRADPKEKFYSQLAKNMDDAIRQRADSTMGGFDAIKSIWEDAKVVWNRLIAQNPGSSCLRRYLTEATNMVELLSLYRVERTNEREKLSSYM